MALNSNQYVTLQRELIKLSVFESQSNLFKFMQENMPAFAGNTPERNSIQARVQALIAYLQDRGYTSTHERYPSRNALSVFLECVINKYDAELAVVLDEVKKYNG